jgi:hypothetical protein
MWKKKEWLEMKGIQSCFGRRERREREREREKTVALSPLTAQTTTLIGGKKVYYV